MNPQRAAYLFGLLAASLSACSAGATSLTGRVFEDRNRNGVLDGGEPCVNALVHLYQGGVLLQEARVRCAGNAPGSYYFDLPSAGAYRLEVVDTPGASLGLPFESQGNFPVAEGSGSVLRDLPLIPTGTSIRSGIAVIQGVVQQREGSPHAGVAVALQNEVGALLRLATTDATGSFAFERVDVGTYRLVVTDPLGVAGGNAVPGAGASRIDADTLRITVTGGTFLSDGHRFLKPGRAVAPAPERLAEAGEPAPAPGLLGIVRTDPAAPDRDVSTVRAIGPEGHLLVADFAGTSLYDLRNRNREARKRLGTGGGAQASDPLDGRGLARLLRVEAASNGQFAVTALRADNRLAVYHQGPRGLRHLGFIDHPSQESWSTNPVELAISDLGQVAFAGRGSDSRLSVFQTPSDTGDPRAVIASRVASAVRDLQTNGRGDLAFRFDYPQGNVLYRKEITAADAQPVAGIGSMVPVVRGQAQRGELRRLERPRIGPDGTVIFQGSGRRADGETFRTFYRSPASGGGPEPLFAQAEWNDDPTSFDYDVGAGGIVALRVTAANAAEPELYVAAPAQDPVRVILEPASDRRRLLPRGRPLLVGEWLFFLAVDPNLPPDRNGSFPLGLYRVQRAFAGLRRPTAVAAYGQSIGSVTGPRLLGVTQQPVVTGDRLALGVLFQGGRALASGERFPSPTPGFVRLPLDGTVERAGLEVIQGDPLASADLRAAVEDLYYAAGGSLVVESRLPGAGPLVEEIPSGRNSGAPPPGHESARIQAPPPLKVLLRSGFDLGEGRRLVDAPQRIVALPPDRQSHLFVARFTQNGVAAGEGLFTIQGEGTRAQVRTLAVTDTLVPDRPGGSLIFRAFSAQRAFPIQPPSAAADGTIAFQALVEERGTVSVEPRVGLFRLAPRERAPVLLGPVEKRALLRWAVARDGRLFYLARTPGGHSLVEAPIGGTSRELATGRSLRVAGRVGTLTHLEDFVLNGAGEIFLCGAVNSVPGIFRLDPQQIAVSVPQATVVAAAGELLPPCGYAARVPGWQYQGEFVLRAESLCGPLYFEARVLHTGERRREGRVQMRVMSGGCAEVLFLASMELHSTRKGGERRVGQPLNDPCDDVAGVHALRQDPSSPSVGAFAVRDEQSGFWSIYRSRGERYSLVAQERPPGDRAGVFVLDAGPMLGLAPGHGPVFAVNEQGEVAFLASDGKGWGVYRSVEPGSGP